MRLTAEEYRHYIVAQPCACGRQPEAVKKNGMWRVECACGRRTDEYFIQALAVMEWNKEVRW